MLIVSQARALAGLPKNLAALLAVAAPAAAQQPAQAAGQALKEACRNDDKTLCSGVRPGGGRIVACLLAAGRQAVARLQAGLDGGPVGEAGWHGQAVIPISKHNGRYVLKI